MSESQRVLLAHAERLWRSEENNATRLAAKSNLVAAGITATMGFKLFWVGRAIEAIVQMHWVLIGFFVAASLFTIGCLVFALWGVLDVRLRHADTPSRPSRPSFASGWMMPSEGSLFSDQLPARDVVATLIGGIQRATVDLTSRNTKRKSSVERAERRLMYGLAVAIVTASVYAVSSGIQAADRIKKSGAGQNVGQQHGQPAPPAQGKP